MKWIVAVMSVAAMFALSADEVVLRMVGKKQAAPSEKVVENGAGLPLSEVHPGDYNLGASIQVSGSWDVNATVSYILWYANQDVMDVGLVQPFSAPGFSSGGTVAYQNFDYNSGF